ncbi:hypothetical protein K458DRAFT_23175 [Lentithecium fluviatile CBS 122367]|uniref:Uncharacterized protein n=1 Tax=Lentithecium fluviatile CBS 122367 TaxID=1168545 RepID=A0A6G1J5E6_9PLEO|nr:hypothetical protein K458DRAFT_23175 [Lentithecium fluviatile CBS 122367]
MRPSLRARRLAGERIRPGGENSGKGSDRRRMLGGRTPGESSDVERAAYLWSWQTSGGGERALDGRRRVGASGPCPCRRASSHTEPNAASPSRLDKETLAQIRDVFGHHGHHSFLKAQFGRHVFFSHVQHMRLQYHLRWRFRRSDETYIRRSLGCSQLRACHGSSSVSVLNPLRAIIKPTSRHPMRARKIVIEACAAALQPTLHRLGISHRAHEGKSGRCQHGQM